MATEAQATTEIVNKTQGTLTVQVGNHRYFVALVTLEKDAKYTMPVDFNATYQEYLMGVDEAGRNLIVTSDDCCDYKCITIQEADGKFNMHREPRRSVTPPIAAKPDSRSLAASDGSATLIDGEEGDANVLAKKYAKPMQLVARIWGNLWGNLWGNFIRTP